jgi:hypothetical protein
MNRMLRDPLGCDPNGANCDPTRDLLAFLKAL